MRIGRSGECNRQANRVPCVRVVRDVSCVRSVVRDSCLRCRVVKGLSESSCCCCCSCARCPSGVSPVSRFSCFFFCVFPFFHITLFHFGVFIFSTFYFFLVWFMFFWKVFFYSVFTCFFSLPCAFESELWLRASLSRLLYQPFGQFCKYRSFALQVNASVNFVGTGVGVFPQGRAQTENRVVVTSDCACSWVTLQDHEEECSQTVGCCSGLG